MPIQLDTPFNPGDLDPGNEYPHVKINGIQIFPEEKRIYVSWTYGEEISGVWHQGSATRHDNVWIDGSAYETMVLEEISGVDNQLIYNGVKRVLYQYLIDNDVIIGEIV